MAKQYDKQFKLNAVAYRFDHPELTIKECATKLGVPYDTYHGWLSAHKNKGENAFRGSGNYSSDEAKEIARLKRELRDTQDALEVLKKAIGILGEKQ
jgi:transposase